jgi:hypothetical protein
MVTGLFMCVKSHIPNLPNGCSCMNTTSLASPCKCRHCLILRSKVRRDVELNVSLWYSHKWSKMPMGVISGSCFSSGKTTGSHIGSRGSSRVRWRTLLCFSCCRSLSMRPAVLTDMPAWQRQSLVNNLFGMSYIT